MESKSNLKFRLIVMNFLEFAVWGAYLTSLGRYLGLPKPPDRMECFDISHNQGSETVASMVVFEGGLPKKSDYRRFKIQSTEGKPDDFLSMREVTTRRYVDLPEEELPDLIIIDGGKGQLSSALEIIRNVAGHMQVPVVVIWTVMAILSVAAEFLMS